MRRSLLFLMVALLALPASDAVAQTAPDGGVASAPGVPAPAEATARSPDDTDASDDDTGSHRRDRRHGRHDGRVNVGGSVEVKQGETVREAVAVGGSTTVLGHVRGDAVAIGGSVLVKNGAHVEGDCVSIGGSVNVEDGAVVDGEHVSIGSFLGPVGLTGVAGTFGALALVWTVGVTLLQVLGLLALGSLFVAFLPGRMDRMKQAIVTRPGPAGGVGVLALVGIVPATVLLVVTIVGIVLVPFLWLFFGVVVALGLTLVAQLIGERLPMRAEWRGPFVTLAIGSLVLALVRLVPFLGSVVFVAAMLVGIGAVLLTRFGAPVANPEPAAPGPHAAASDETSLPPHGDEPGPDDPPK